MSNDKEFKWTDSDLVEFASFCTRRGAFSGYYSDLEDFKKSKEPKKDYEILQCKSNSLGIHHYVCDGHCPCSRENFKYCKIHSVKRLSDNEVFTVGDKIEGFGGTPVITIEKFDISYFTPNTISAYHNNGFGRNISAWKKVKEPKIFHAVQKATLDILPDCIHPLDKPNEWEVFDTIDKAREYVIMNKPLLSINEIFSNSISAGEFGCTVKLSHLKKLAQQKINGL